MTVLTDFPADSATAVPDRHPPALRMLFLTEMWERFSYYGMRALLVLYLVNSLHYERKDALALYGTYTGARLPDADHRRLSRRPLPRPPQGDPDRRPDDGASVTSRWRSSRCCISRSAS